MKIKIEGRFEVEVDEDKYLRNSTMFDILLSELFQRTSKSAVLEVNPFSMELPGPSDAGSGSAFSGENLATSPSRMSDEEFQAWLKDSKGRRNKRRKELGLPLLPEPVAYLEPEDDEPSLLQGKRSAKRVVRKTRRRGTV